MKSNRFLLRTTIVSVLLTLIFSQLYAVPAYEINFVKGNIAQKTQAVIDAGDQNDVTLAVKAIDFCLEEHPLLGDDPDLLNLIQTAVQTVGTDPHKGQLPGLSEKLVAVFKSFQTESIRVLVLERITFFPSDNSVMLINSFVSDSAFQKQAMSPVILKAISSLGKIGNASSFSLLFAIDLDEIWPAYEKQIEYSLGMLANSCEKEILTSYESSTIDKKIRIIEIIAKNENISSNIKGDVAQIALSESISNTGNSSTDQIPLQLLALKILSDSHWTRAAMVVNDYFPVARLQYENNALTADQFAQVISNTAGVAAPETASTLSSYLDSLNKDMEKGKIPAKQVVLALIHALGGLGDKTAFDYLLYVTYLEYPEEVISAARDALAKLKW
jgi:hypothetical protein